MTGIKHTAAHVQEDQVRKRLLAGLPVTERRLELAGITTAVLEGGDGRPVVLLHEPIAHAAKWSEVIPDLAVTHRVIAPDLPGHGASEVRGGPLDADRVLAWLGELIRHTCDQAPVLVGLILGGAIAARFAAAHGDRVEALILVDSMGLAPFAPAPEFGQALETYLTEPTEANHDHFWRHCTFDLDRLRKRMGARWEAFVAHDLRSLRTPTVQAALQTMMAEFVMPAIPPEDLCRIAVPTTLIWGRQDLANRLEVAEAASARYGWPLHVIEDCADDPPLDQPEAFLGALRRALDRS